MLPVLSSASALPEKRFPPRQLRGNTGTTAAASCSDAATHTKEILIAPLDGNLQSDPWMGKRRRVRDMPPNKYW